MRLAAFVRLPVFMISYILSIFHTEKHIQEQWWQLFKYVVITNIQFYLKLSQLFSKYFLLLML